MLDLEQELPQTKKTIPTSVNILLNLHWSKTDEERLVYMPNPSMWIFMEAMSWKL
jgi:hypothetical protein